MSGSFIHGINFDRMPCIYWDNTTKISYLQRRIIVHSILYYELNESCITDKEFDAISHQLVHLQLSVDKAEFEQSTYYYAMYDFDASTGFNIPDRLTEKDRDYLTKIAQLVIAQYRSGGKGRKE